MLQLEVDFIGRWLQPSGWQSTGPASWQLYFANSPLPPATLAILSGACVVHAPMFEIARIGSGLGLLEPDAQYLSSGGPSELPALAQSPAGWSAIGAETVASTWANATIWVYRNASIEWLWGDGDLEALLGAVHWFAYQKLWTPQPPYVPLFPFSPDALNVKLTPAMGWKQGESHSDDYDGYGWSYLSDPEHLNLTCLYSGSPRPWLGIYAIRGTLEFIARTAETLELLPPGTADRLTQLPDWRYVAILGNGWDWHFGRGAIGYGYLNAHRKVGEVDTWLTASEHGGMWGVGDIPLLVEAAHVIATQVPGAPEPFPVPIPPDPPSLTPEFVNAKLTSDGRWQPVAPNRWVLAADQSAAVISYNADGTLSAEGELRFIAAAAAALQLLDQFVEQRLEYKKAHGILLPPGVQLPWQYAYQETTARLDFPMPIGAAAIDWTDGVLRGSGAFKLLWQAASDISLIPEPPPVPHPPPNPTPHPDPHPGPQPPTPPNPPGPINPV